MTYIIKHENGTFWNAENNCWTVARTAATRYKNVDKVPDKIDGLEWDKFACGYYFRHNEHASAKMYLDV